MKTETKPQFPEAVERSLVEIIKHFYQKNPDLFEAVARGECNFQQLLKMDVESVEKGK